MSEAKEKKVRVNCDDCEAFGVKVGAAIRAMKTGWGSECHTCHGRCYDLVPASEAAGRTLFKGRRVREDITTVYVEVLRSRPLLKQVMPYEEYRAKNRVRIPKIA